MYYKNKQTGEILTKTQTIDIETRIGSIPGAIYCKAGTFELVVISDLVAANLLDSCLSKFPIDLYAILHQKVNKQLAVELAAMIEAEYAQSLDQDDE